jgi:signal transduction histidine kinase
VDRTPTGTLLRVADTGVGIAPEHLPHLFERFYRVDKARARAEGGAGLGLAISQWVARAHGGDITVESRPGRGTTFTVRLPRQCANQTGVPSPSVVTRGEERLQLA